MGVDREALTADWQALEAACDRLLGHDCDALSTPELLAWLARVETLRRRLPALEHPLISTLARQASPEEPDGMLSHAIAEATGEPMPPLLAGTAAGPPAKTPTVTPNRSPHPTWTADDPAPTPTGTHWHPEKLLHNEDNEDNDEEHTGSGAA